MHGKRSVRTRFPKQIGQDPEKARIIRERASRKLRTLDLELVHLIDVGIEHDPEFAANGNRREELHAPAHDGTSTSTAMHGAAPRSTPLHAPARKEGVA